MRSIGWLLGGCVSAYASVASAGVYDTITLDGGLSDWDSGALLYSDVEIQNAGNANASYNAVYVANDADNLYVGIRTDGASGGSITNDWAHNLYLDANNTSTTGFDGGWMLNGYDFLAQYGLSGSTYSVFQFTGASQSAWSWNWLNTFSYSFTGDTMEWSIPLELLGNPNSLVVELNSNGTGANGESWAFAWESGAKTYTIAPLPEPASLMLAAAGGVVLLRRRR